MTSFTFSAEQVRSAPPEVRRWMENEIARALGSQVQSEYGPTKAQAGALAAATVDEVAQIFNLLSGNFLLTQVFFELARETPLAPGLPSLHGLSLNDMRRHIQLDDIHQLPECLNVINQALQRVRNDSAATLFARDEQGHIYIHETSHRNIRKLREQLIAQHYSEAQPHEAADFVPADLEAREPVMQVEHAFPQTPDARTPGRLSQNIVDAHYSSLPAGAARLHPSFETAQDRVVARRHANSLDQALPLAAAYAMAKKINNFGRAERRPKQLKGQVARSSHIRQALVDPASHRLLLLRRGNPHAKEPPRRTTRRDAPRKEEAS